MLSLSLRRTVPTVVLLTGIAFGCDSSSPNTAQSPCRAGERLCTCYVNQTCNPGLECRSNTCIDAVGSNSGGASGNANSVAAEGGQIINTVAATQTGGNGVVTQPSSSGGNTVVGSTPVCVTGSEACACFGNDSCNAGLTCLSHVCVALGPLGSAGAAATSGGAPATGGAAASGAATTGGAPTAGGSAAIGGASSPAAGGSPATGGAPATGGTTATSNAPASGGMPPNTGGTSAVNNSPIIDAFASCDDRIENNAGRAGKWYSFADSDFNMTHGFGDPGTQWTDHGCAAWIIMGCIGTACTFAGIGLQLADGNPYDLSSYSGITVAFEGKDNVYFVAKTSDGGYFGTWISGTTGNQTRNVNFADLAAMSSTAVTTLNTRLITELQFTIGKAVAVDAGAGFAIHSVSLR